MHTLSGSAFGLTASVVRQHTFVALGVAALGIGSAASAQNVIGWGSNPTGHGIAAPTGLGAITQVSGGYGHLVALRSDGSLVCWGQNSSGQCNIPSNLGPLTTIDAGANHNIAIQSNGLIACWGDNGSGQCNVPFPFFSQPATAVSAGWNHSLAVMATGQVIAWGANGSPQSTVPVGLWGASAVSAGSGFSLAVVGGSVVGWGDNSYGQASIGIGGVVGVDTGYYHTITMDASGAVACFGANWYGQCNVPSGLGSVVAVAAGGNASAAIRSNGTVVAWGSGGLAGVPTALTGLTATKIAASVGGDFGAAVFPNCPAPGVNRSSGNLGSVGFGQPREFEFTGLSLAPVDAVKLRIQVRSDLNLQSEFLTVRIDGQPFATVFVETGTDCGTDSVELAIPAGQFGQFAADQKMLVRIDASAGVNPTQCGDPFCEISLNYETAVIDCDGDGVSDLCEILANPALDCNGNLALDVCDLWSGLATDVNQNGVVDSCEPDCNGNGVPDSFEFTQGTAIDCNGNLQHDSCDIATGASSDVDSNGIPDSCQIDCNSNGIPDLFEIALEPSKDCNLNSVIDACEIAANPALDCDADGILDACEGQSNGVDCDGNGLIDSCEIAAGAQDKDGDGRLDVCQLAYGDFNLDGQIGGDDLSLVLVLWGFTNPPLGDLNGDGVVGGEDLSTLLVRWGPY